MATNYEVRSTGQNVTTTVDINPNADMVEIHVVGYTDANFDTIVDATAGTITVSGRRVDGKTKTIGVITAADADTTFLADVGNLDQITLVVAGLLTATRIIAHVKATDLG